MGLDQYAYVASKANTEYDDSSRQDVAYWRKHPNLQGWMEQLYRNRGGNAEMFNGVELELTWADLEALEADILENNLPATSGFFFGSNSDEYYRHEDLAFVKQAKAELFTGLKVFYNSSW